MKELLKFMKNNPLAWLALILDILKIPFSLVAIFICLIFIWKNIDKWQVCLAILFLCVVTEYYRKNTRFNE